MEAAGPLLTLDAPTHAKSSLGASTMFDPQLTPRGRTCLCMQRKPRVEEAGLEPVGFSPIAEMVQSAEVRFLTGLCSKRSGAYHSIHRIIWKGRFRKLRGSGSS